MRLVHKLEFGVARSLALVRMAPFVRSVMQAI